MTHQEIVERYAALNDECSEKRKAIDEAAIPARNALQAECAAVGHIYSWAGVRSFWLQGRLCAVCGTPEPAPQ